MILNTTIIIIIIIIIIVILLKYMKALSGDAGSECITPDMRMAGAQRAPGSPDAKEGS